MCVARDVTSRSVPDGSGRRSGKKLALGLFARGTHDLVGAVAAAELSVCKPFCA
jgi:hypothetical protein